MENKVFPSSLLRRKLRPIALVSVIHKPVSNVNKNSSSLILHYSIIATKKTCAFKHSAFDFHLSENDLFKSTFSKDLNWLFTNLLKFEPSAKFFQEYFENSRSNDFPEWFVP